MKYNSIKKNNYLFFLAIVAYPLLQFTVFYVIVNVNSLFLAFKSFNIKTGDYYFIGFDNFIQVIKDIANDYTMKTATINSLKLYLSSLFILFPLSLLFSFFLYKKVPFHNFFRVILFLPQIISALVISLMFRYFVEQAVPSFIEKLTHVRIPNLLQDKDTGFSVMIFYCIWSGFGTQILIYSSSMSSISQSLVEAGEMDGMNSFQEFIHITLPSIYPTITIFLVQGVAGLFTNQAGLYNFFGSNARDFMQTLGYIFFRKIVGSSDATFAQYPYAAAAGILFTLIATPITLIAKYLLEKFGPSED